MNHFGCFPASGDVITCRTVKRCWAEQEAEILTCWRSVRGVSLSSAFEARCFLCGVFKAPDVFSGDAVSSSAWIGLIGGWWRGCREERWFPPEPINHRTRSDCRAALPEHQQRSVLGSSNKRNNKFFIILWEPFSRCWAEVKNLGWFFYSSMSVRSTSLLLFSLTELFKSLKSVKYQHLCINYAKDIYKLKLGPFLCYLMQEQILLF